MGPEMRAATKLMNHVSAVTMKKFKFNEQSSNFKNANEVRLAGDRQFDSPDFYVKYVTNTSTAIDSGRIVNFGVVQKGQVAGELEKPVVRDSRIFEMAMTHTQQLTCQVLLRNVQAMRYQTQVLYKKLVYYEPPTYSSKIVESSFIPIASIGYCDLACDKFVWYIILFSLFVFVHSTSEVGSMLLILRCVDPRDKAMALGLIQFAIGLFGIGKLKLRGGASVFTWSESGKLFRKYHLSAPDRNPSVISSSSACQLNTAGVQEAASAESLMNAGKGAQLKSLTSCSLFTLWFQRGNKQLVACGVLCVEEMCSALGSGRYLEEGQEGNVPCPIVYGAVVDSACLVWETTCGERGACWLYDANVFRMFFHGHSKQGNSKKGGGGVWNCGERVAKEVRKGRSGRRSRRTNDRLVFLQCNVEVKRLDFQYNVSLHFVCLYILCASKSARCLPGTRLYSDLHGGENVGGRIHKFNDVTRCHHQQTIAAGPAVSKVATQYTQGPVSPDETESSVCRASGLGFFGDWFRSYMSDTGTTGAILLCAFFVDIIVWYKAGSINFVDEQVPIQEEELSPIASKTRSETSRAPQPPDWTLLDMTGLDLTGLMQICATANRLELTV
uniref:Uncharacterized protein n=1 Tax=Timema bartmani TaxID=61472 RepID=A0A7R9F391_9NEOP|nr:unnamed protein product [Timema bartmani]